MIDMMAVFSPKTGNKSICSNLVADPYPAVAYSPKTPIYVSIMKLPTEINSKAVVIGAD